MIELGGIIVLGIAAQWLAWRTRVPAILPLIICGLLVGPIAQEYLGHKLIDPLYDPETNNGLFPAKSLFYFVSLAIGIILFEGGLTLKRKEFVGVGTTVIKLITLGSLITFIGAGIAAHFIVGLNWYISFLFAGLIIVTGPTVIAPILRNVPLNKNVAAVLKWEGILIDPIGALVAVLVYEFIISGQGQLEFTNHAFGEFSKIVLVGLALGSFCAIVLKELIVREKIPRYLLNVFTLAAVIFAFVVSDLLAHESGLLTVVVMGTLLGNMKVPHLEEILDFKESITVLLISILFIVLSANINMSDLRLLDWRAYCLFAFVVFVLRPMSIFASTAGSELNIREKLFLSWVGPRGIVAAGIASVFGLKLTTSGVADAEMITPLVFMIVMGTVFLNATSVGFVAKKLGILLEASNGIVLVGANQAARLLGKYLQKNGRTVVLLDNSSVMVQEAQEEGLKALQANVYDERSKDNFELLDVGYLFAMTGSDEVNQYACDHLQEALGEKGAYRLVSRQELKNDKIELPNNTLFSKSTDFINLMEAARDYTLVHELPLDSLEQRDQLLEQMDNEKYSIPVFIKRPNNKFDTILSSRKNLEFLEGDVLVYMGRKLVAEEAAIAAQNLRS